MQNTLKRRKLTIVFLSDGSGPSEIKNGQTEENLWSVPLSRVNSHCARPFSCPSVSDNHITLYYHNFYIVCAGL